MRAGFTASLRSRIFATSEQVSRSKVLRSTNHRGIARLQTSKSCSLLRHQPLEARAPRLPCPARHLFSTSKMSSKYPSRKEIEELFGNLATGNSQAFFARVSPEVDWTVMGTHPCAGRYDTLEAFQKATFARLGNIMKDPGLRLAVRNVIGGADQEWCTVELVVNAECKNGKPYLAASTAFHSGLRIRRVQVRQLLFLVLSV